MFIHLAHALLAHAPVVHLPVRTVAAHLLPIGLKPVHPIGIPIPPVR